MFTKLHVSFYLSHFRKKILQSPFLLQGLLGNKKRDELHQILLTVDI